MVVSSEHSTSTSSVPDDGKGEFADEKGSPFGVKNPLQSLPTAIDLESVNTEVTYPEGGRDAWLVVLGAWCGLTASLGIYNTAGVFEVVISKVILPEKSPSSLGWLFSIYAFVNWFCGVQIGPTFDAMGPRALIIAGTLCTLIGIFSLSVCTGRIGLHLELHVYSTLVAICQD